MVKLPLKNQMMNKQKRKKTKGFTLIEIMVAVSIFSIVALIVSGAFITLADIFKKTQTNRAVVDNINLTMDTMTLQIREGMNHQFNDSCTAEEPFSCYQAIVFDEFVNSGIGRHLLYKIEDKSIVQCEGNQTSDCPKLTSPEVEVDTLSFYKSPSFDSGSPVVVLLVGGTVFARDNLSTNFSLQTTLTLRNYRP